jgi:hypothetical protein
MHLEEGMERPTFVYLKSADHAQTEEILVKSPRLFGITATISIVVQPLDHPTLPSLQLIHTASLSFQCLRNSRPKPVIGVAPASFFASTSTMIQEIGFALDSPVERTGFETLGPPSEGHGGDAIR